LLIVFALHATVVTVLVIASWTHIPPTPTAPPLELLILPRDPTPPVPSAPPESNRSRKNTAPSQALPADALTAITPNPNPEIVGPIGPPIDWSHEAHTVAESIAKGAPPVENTKPSSHSVFAAPPPHYKGEQIPTADGRWMVYVSENCYQMSKDITYIENKTNTGKSIQTYCNRRSKEPRGDLFKDLAAYKKLHPSD
jgi:hypothetical protein